MGTWPACLLVGQLMTRLGNAGLGWPDLELRAMAHLAAAAMLECTLMALQLGGTADVLSRQVPAALAPGLDLFASLSRCQSAALLDCLLGLGQALVSAENPLRALPVLGLPSRRHGCAATCPRSSRPAVSGSVCLATWDFINRHLRRALLQVGTHCCGGPACAGHYLPRAPTAAGSRRWNCSVTPSLVSTLPQHGWVVGQG